MENNATSSWSKRALQATKLCVVGSVLASCTQQAASHSAQTERPRVTHGETIKITGAQALKALGKLAIKGRAPATHNPRAQFGSGWLQKDHCDTRNDILRRDLTVTSFNAKLCEVLTGTLDDPYTGHPITFVRKRGSGKVQIDHVVALGDAWQTGAQQMTRARRVQFANDPLELLAVSGETNDAKGDGDAATWLPPNKVYRCTYVAKQILVKERYHLWVTPAEDVAMERVLNSCQAQEIVVPD